MLVLVVVPKAFLGRRLELSMILSYSRLLQLWKRNVRPIPVVSSSLPTRLFRGALYSGRSKGRGSPATHERSFTLLSKTLRDTLAMLLYEEHSSSRCRAQH